MAPQRRSGNRPKPRPRKTKQGPVSWRGQRSAESPGEAGSGFSIFRWKQRDVSPTGYWMRLLLWFGLIGLMAYMLVDWLRRGDRQAPFIAIHVTSYNDPLISPNSYAREDVERFRQQWPTGEGRIKTIGTDASVRFVGDAEERQYDKESFLAHLRDQLANQKPGGPRNDLVFVYISAHGVVDAMGEPCLLLSESKARSSETWLPLDAVVRVLGEQDKTSKRILILDCVRTFQDPRIGLLYNSFVDRLEDVRFRHSDPNLVIISASGRGDQAWAAPELNGTIFGQRLAVGLSGAADDANGDKRISLGELVDFLEQKVQHWVMTKRTSRQSPLAIASASIEERWRNWTVAEAMPPSNVQSNVEEAVDGIPEYVEKRRDAVAGLWQQLDEPLTYDALAKPVQLAELQFQLIRLEQLLLAGKAYDVQFNRTLGLARKWLVDVRAAGQRQDALGRSLPLAQQAFCDGQRREEKTFYDRWKAGPNVAEWNKVAEEENIKLASMSAGASGGLLWLERDLAASGVETTQINDLLGVLDLLPSSQPTDLPDFVEVHFLRMLAKHLHPGTSSSSIHRAITARQFAERAAAPSDYRTHYWIQNAVNQGDESRRLAEDHLFVGADASLKEADSLWDKVDGENGLYRQAIVHAEAISKAYLVRDISYAMLPHFSDWLLRKARLDASHADAAELTTLNSLIADTHLLATQLDQDFDPLRGSSNSHDDDIIAMSELADGIWASLAALATDVHDSWSEYRELEGQKAVKPWLTMLNSSVIPLTIEERQSGAVEIRHRGEDLGTLLAIDSQQRNQLRERLLEIVFEHDDTGSVADSGTDPSGTSPSEGKAAADVFLKLLGSLDRHPVLNLLTLDTPELPDIDIPERTGDEPANRLKHLSLQGDAIRTLLLNAHDKCESLAKIGVVLREARQGGRVARKHLAKAERLWRMNAGVLGITASTASTESAVTQLRQRDQSFLALWHSHRVLNDFWAASSDQAEPYFAATTGFLLRSSQPFLRYGETDLKKRLRDYWELVKSNRGVVSPDVKPEAEEQGDDRFQVQLGLNKSEGTPEGLAALFLRQIDKNSTPIDALIDSGSAPRLPVDLAEDRKPPHEVSFLASDVSYARSIDSVALFRGHVRSETITITSTEQGDVLVSDEPQKLSNSRIRVVARSAKPTHLIFVFDCSASMSTMDAFSEGGRIVPRIDAAREAVNDVMQSLLEMPEQNYVVSFYAYGHRAGSYKTGNQIRYSKYYKNKIALGASDIHPSLDVEPLVERERLTREQWNRLYAVVESLKPHGWTPLYFSINRVLEDLCQAQDRLSKQVIVITDGDNRLFSDVTDGVDGPLPEATSVRVNSTFEKYGSRQSPKLNQDYADLKKGLDIRTSIVGLGKEITSDINLGKQASFYRVKNEKQKLIDHLKDTLGLVKYSVAGPQPSDPQYVGDDWLAERLFGNPTKHTVQLHSSPPAHLHDVFLEGGERIVLKYNHAERQLEHRRYPESGATVGKCDNLNFHVSALYPDTRSLPNVTFRVTIQNAVETKFSPRPVSFWAKVTPTGFGGRKPNPVPVYHFSDMRFVDEMPVPVLQFTVRNWPNNAKQAEIDLWFRMQDDLKPDWKGDAESKKSFKVKAISEGDFDMKTVPNRMGNGFTLTVTETYGTSATDLQRSRVMAFPPPSKTVRTLLKKSGGVRHQFHYWDGFARPETTGVEITARDTIQREYIGLVEPIQIRLGD